MNIFSAENLTCVRGGRIVFTCLDFTLEAGNALMLVGPNGSGKSSLLRLMAGLLEPAAGNLKWGREEIHEDPEIHSGRLHYIGHLDAVKPTLSVFENVLFWASLMNGNSENGEATIKALNTFGLGHLEKVPGRFLSTGQRQRVKLARILASPAPLWLLDEPTAGLDKETITTLETAINHHCTGGGLVVISTHSDVQLPDHQVIDLAGFSETHMKLEHEQ
jgi:heme exporter protein A